MTAEAISNASSELQLRTYLSLGLSTPGAMEIEETGFTGCLGAFDHPICNFAGRLSLDPWVANKLFDLAVSRPGFNVYSAPGDLPVRRDVRNEIMVRAGFKVGFQLQQMVSEIAPTIAGTPFDRATGSLRRKEISTFMSNQFFGRRSVQFRRRLVDATANATDLDLYGVRVNGQLLAALMLVEDPSILGLFNLCVKPLEQGKGLGSGIVAEAQRIAFESSRILALQCDESLVSWYEKLGFRKSGVVDVYILPDDRRIAIMN